MKPEQIFEAISYVDEELLLKSENNKDAGTKETDRMHVKSNIVFLRRWGTLAACACLVIVLFAVSPLRMVFFSGGSGSTAQSSEEYEAAETDEATEGKTEDNEETILGATGETAALWVTYEGIDYQELTVDESSKFDLTEEELENIPESDIGERFGYVEDASVESLMGEEIYYSKKNENLFIIKTTNGYRYFYKIS